jgi:hypothetical protein
MTFLPPATGPLSLAPAHDHISMGQQGNLRSRCSRATCVISSARPIPLFRLKGGELRHCWHRLERRLCGGPRHPSGTVEKGGMYGDAFIEIGIQFHCVLRRSRIRVSCPWFAAC